MSAADLVKGLCHQTNEEMLVQQAGRWTSADLATCKEVISWVKKIIKTKKEPPSARLMALKVPSNQLFHQCMLRGNINFLTFASKKVMSRFTILASYKKQLREANRGEDIFGAASTVSAQTRRDSAAFLQCLLTYIRIWSQRYGKMQDGSMSLFSQAYTKLTNAAVAFPPAEPPLAVVQNRPVSGAPRGIVQPLTREELEERSNAAQLLNSLLDSSSPDVETMAEMNTELTTFLLRIERELNLKTGQAGMEDYVSQLFEMNDFLRQTLEKYERFKLNRIAPAHIPSAALDNIYLESEEQELQRAMAESIRISSPSPVSNGQSEAELAEKQSTLRALQEELNRTKQQAMDYAREAEQRKELAGRLRTEGERDLQARETRYSQEIQATMALMGGAEANRGKLSAAQSMLEGLKRQLSEKENEHRAILKALTSVQEENNRLKQAFALQSSPALYASQDFATIRPSAQAFPVPFLPPLPTQSAQVPPDNASFLLNSLQINKGLVYTDAEIEVGFLFKQAGTMLLYVGNKSQSELTGLQTVVTDSPAEGLRLAINKQTEEQGITYKGKVNRVVTIERSGVFLDLPSLQLSYQ